MYIPFVWDADDIPTAAELAIMEEDDRDERVPNTDDSFDYDLGDDLYDDDTEPF